MNEISGYLLLADRGEYERFHARNAARYGGPPSCYPCFVQEVFDSETSTYYQYLSPEDLTAMLAALSKPDSTDRDRLPLNILVHLVPKRDLPAFGAYLAGETVDPVPTILINFGAIFSVCADHGFRWEEELTDTFLHEVLHHLQHRFRLAFSELQVDETIAAARRLDGEQPDLYQAVQQLLADAEAEHGPCDCGDTNVCTRCYARAALKRAEGAFVDPDADVTGEIELPPADLQERRDV